MQSLILPPLMNRYCGSQSIDFAQVAESVGPLCADALRETTKQLEIRIFKNKQSELDTKKLFTVRIACNFVATMGQL